MAVSATAGKIYDTAEFGKLDTFLSMEQAQMDLIDKEKQFQNKKVVQYALIFAGTAITLVLFTILVGKKK